MASGERLVHELFLHVFLFEFADGKWTIIKIATGILSVHILQMETQTHGPVGGARVRATDECINCKQTNKPNGLLKMDGCIRDMFCGANNATIAATQNAIMPELINFDWKIEKLAI